DERHLDFNLQNGINDKGHANLLSSCS
ncbi:unnamed protein product, partial [Caretta caretta]